MIDLSCDYNCGCAPEILSALEAANGEQHATYGFDDISERAKEKIKLAVGNADAEVFFLVGGTQTNATVLSSILAPYQGVLSAGSGHIAVHEAGAVEYTGHKVLTVGGDEYGRIDLEALRGWLRAFSGDATRTHMVQPGAVYVSHPTEYGGLYTAAQLRELRAICDEYGLKLFLDGARLAYALAARGADVDLKLLGELCDVFYIGGTKCGALLGEAVVFKKPEPFFFTTHKQHGALLAKGFLIGLQFDALFTDGLYLRLGAQAIDCAEKLREGLYELDVGFCPESRTNQQFPYLSDEQLEKLDGRIGYEIWERRGGGAVVRLCTSWRTTAADIDAVLGALGQ